MAGFTTVEVQTRGSQDIVDLTSEVRKAVRGSGVSDGICVVFSMHTTAGITINENADPDVKTDLIAGLSRAFPEREDYRHSEGSSHSPSAHLVRGAVADRHSVRRGLSPRHLAGGIPLRVRRAPQKAHCSQSL